MGALCPSDWCELLGRVACYQGEQLIKSEDERERRRQERMAELRRRFVDGPVLVIPLRMMNIEFNPNNLQPLDELGTVYPTGRITDAWGILSVSGGMLLSSDWPNVRVPAPDDIENRPLTGDGWTLELQGPWRPAPGDRPGDYRLTWKKPSGE